MALLPTVGFEDKEFFYFSGGNTAYPVNDFSKGMAEAAPKIRPLND